MDTIIINPLLHLLRIACHPATVKKSEKRLVESIAVNGSDASKIAYRLILNIKDATYERVVRSLSRTPSDTILDSDDITEDSTDRKGNT